MISLDDLAIGPEWERAEAWFNDGDPSVLAELIIRGGAIPTPLRAFVADIVTGKRRPPTVGKARKVLNADHKNCLEERAQFIASAANFLTPQEKNYYREDAIAEVVALSGVSVGTVIQAWKKAMSPHAQRARKNKALMLAWKEKRDSSKHIEKLRELGLKNDPFGMCR